MKNDFVEGFPGYHPAPFRLTAIPQYFNDSATYPALEKTGLCLFFANRMDSQRPPLSNLCGE
jgi:hypothetical protein